MKIQINEHSIVVKREQDDPKFYGNYQASGESGLLHFIKKYLNSNGFDLIKKRMWKDGHLVDDCQQYLRSRKVKRDGKAIAIYSGNFALFGINEPWNDNKPVALLKVLI